MNLALFDFDGTITSKDSFAPFLRMAVTRSRAALGNILLAPTVIGYKLGLIPATRTRARVVAFGLRGRFEADICALGERYSREVLPGTVRPKAVDRIKWHLDKGDQVVVVSAALSVYLDAWCKTQHIDVVCTQLEAKDGVLTGRYLGGDCVGPEKARRVRDRYRLSDFEEIYAYGDTAEDAQMLDLAGKKFFRWQEISGTVPSGRRGDHVDLNPDR